MMCRLKDSGSLKKKTRHWTLVKNAEKHETDVKSYETMSKKELQKLTIDGATLSDYVLKKEREESELMVDLTVTKITVNALNSFTNQKSDNPTWLSLAQEQANISLTRECLAQSEIDTSFACLHNLYNHSFKDQSK